MRDPGEDGYFDERIAATFDDDYADQADPAVVGPMVALLARYAGDGRALELGSGTGRIALALAARGVPVHGSSSRAMTAHLKAKPGGESVGVTIGDFATTKAPGQFRVAYLVANTIMNLTTQAAQVACFRNAAAQLEPGGCFVVEVLVPPAAATGRKVPGLRCERGPLGHRRIRRRRSGPHLAPLSAG